MTKPRNAPSLLASRLPPAASAALGVVAFSALGLFVAAPAWGAENLSAEEIVDKAMENGSIGFSKGTATLQMDITDAKGQTKRRTLDVKAMKDDEGLKTLLKFSRPAEVAGMGFLVVEKADSLPDQFLYMPAARVTRRIPAGNATGSLFGSDFAYVDLMPLPAAERDQAEMTRLDDAKVGGRAAYVVRTDIDVTGSPYSRLVTYVDQQYLMPLRIEFFDEDGKRLKTLKIKALKKVQERLLPTRLVMENVQKGTSTEIRVSDVQPDAPLTASDFTEEALQR